MKTVFINGSPKKKLSVSQYLVFMQGLSVKGEKVKEHLRNQSDHERILNVLKDADSVVFCLPLYVDGVPSHVLSFMKEMEVFCKENKLILNVYVVSNGGFIEGKQNEPLMQVFENFCIRSGINWCGGIGIGGGVMLNVMRIMIFVELGLLLLNIFISGVQMGNWLPMDILSEFVSEILWILLLNAGVIWYSLRMGNALNKGQLCGKKYTRILIPSFLFVIAADIFFVIISVFKGGIFRGWLSKK